MERGDKEQEAREPKRLLSIYSLGIFGKKRVDKLRVIILKNHLASKEAGERGEGEGIPGWKN